MRYQNVVLNHTQGFVQAGNSRLYLGQLGFNMFDNHQAFQSWGTDSQKSINLSGVYSLATTNASVQFANANVGVDSIYALFYAFPASSFQYALDNHLSPVGHLWFPKEDQTAGAPTLVTDPSIVFSTPTNNTTYTAANAFCAVYARDYLPLFTRPYVKYDTSVGVNAFTYPYGTTNVLVVTGSYLPHEETTSLADMPVAARLPAGYCIARHYRGMRFSSTNQHHDFYVFEGPANSVSQNRFEYSFNSHYDTFPFTGDFSTSPVREARLCAAAHAIPSGGESVTIEMCADVMAAYGEEPVGWMIFENYDSPSGTNWGYIGFSEGASVSVVARPVAIDPADDYIVGETAKYAVVPISKLINPVFRFVDFNLNAGEDDAAWFVTGGDPKKVVVGQPYGTLPVAEKYGCVFKGWFTAPTGGTQVTAETVVPSV